jgi:GRAB domain
VTNIVLSFLSTPRGDSKRFEMLSILSTILGWSEEERERAGLQRNLYGNLSVSSPTRKKMPRIDSSSSTTSTGGNEQAETFSNMWVEFLMKEAAQGQGSRGSGLKVPRRPSISGQSDSGTGVGGLSLLSPRSDISLSSNSVYGKRVASLDSLSTLELLKPPGRKSGQGQGQEEKSTERRLL